ncbi:MULTISPECIES: hypothetical protein [Bacillaceae]|uniref:Uncharacterized protein n=2 Tax=Bacillaceae TaxID=186817 RepID=A0A9D5I0X1_9BACI|nr:MULTISPECIES: hypothetical protein [Bacillaceae]KQL55799.1 hypothetical protein AN965_16020 [Alkalicoccobacillus plakortidis]MBG9785460.1 hypothetical protein [Shouchella lehensis]RQW19709.1 hypothetical protein EH196_06040 [Bacillus sp. C1-1]TES47896.1 hypothetical protein E2L03_12190 [Shouchella lehensis]
MGQVEKLDVRVSGVDFTYNFEEEVDEVRLRFNVTDPTGDINANGRVVVTMDEYVQDPRLLALADLAREKLIKRLEPKEESQTD